MRFLCIGMMVCDTLIRGVPQNILQLDSVAIDNPVICCGGDALNVAMGLARLGQTVSIAGRIADDPNGKIIVKACAEAGIDLSGVCYDEECVTAASYALIDEAGERHFLSVKDIFNRLRGEDVSDQAIQDAEYVYIGSAMAMPEMDRHGIQNIFSRAHRQGKVTAMDAAVNREDHRTDWLTYLAPAFMETDIFFPSFDEARIITGESEPERIAECFRRFPMKIFGIKMGAQGCFLTDFTSSRYIKCPPEVKVVDTTGAGDSFMAGMLCGLSQGWDAYESAEFASCVAAKNVGTIGGTAGIPGFDEAYRFYQAQYKA